MLLAPNLAPNLADDADSVAATAGQLAGALYGASGVPARWRDRLAWSGHVAGLAAALFELAPPRDPVAWRCPAVRDSW